MNRIYKYKMKPNTTLELPRGAKVLTARVQDEEVFLWAKVNPDEKELETRMFLGFGTGHDIDDELRLDFIDTVFFQNGMVFHIFEQQ